MTVRDVAIPVKVVVKDYVRSKLRYSLDLTSGVVVPEEEGAATGGYGQWRTLGLIQGRRRCFNAIFVYGDDLALWLEGHLHVLRVPPLSAKVVEVMPFIRRFELSAKGGVSYTAKYFVMERDPWPTDGDLFMLLARVVESEEAVRYFWYVWKASGAGRDITAQAFHDEANEWVKAQRR